MHRDRAKRPVRQVGPVHRCDPVAAWSSSARVSAS
jgi:hypothetical protein